MVTVKRHDRAETILRRRYSFLEQWDAFEKRQQVKLDKLKPGATAAQRCEARRIDLDLEREAFTIRKLEYKKIPRGAYNSVQALRAAVIRGVTAR